MPQIKGKDCEVRLGTNATDVLTSPVATQIESIGWRKVKDVTAEPKGVGFDSRIPVVGLRHVEGTIRRRFDATLLSPGATPTDHFYKWADTDADRAIQIKRKDQAGTLLKTYLFDKVKLGTIDEPDVTADGVVLESVPFTGEIVTES